MRIETRGRDRWAAASSGFATTKRLLRFLGWEPCFATSRLHMRRPDATSLRASIPNAKSGGCEDRAATQ
jgi:hypothetical protein